MKSGIVFDIKQYAVHDGPGIRTTVFFKGCPLSCAWCHNPEGIPPGIRIFHRKESCIGCGSCLSACRKSALRMSEGGVEIIEETCDCCLSCVTACPANALEAVGRRMTVPQVMEEIHRDNPFFETSGGGVTFSGGEPLMQPDFLLDLLKECGKAGIHRAVDTSGFCNPDVLMEIADETDLFLYDVKIMDSRRHKDVTGKDNGIILSNLRMLAEKGAVLEIRAPLIPGMNDDTGNLEKMGSFVRDLPGVSRITVLPYHDFHASKYRRFQEMYSLDGTRPPDTEALTAIRSKLESFNLEVGTGG